MSDCACAVSATVPTAHIVSEHGVEMDWSVTGSGFCASFSGCYNVSAQPVTRLHWLPATRRPDHYHDRTPTGPASRRQPFGKLRTDISGHTKRVLASACSWVCFVC
jgi:hypothetical protein